MNCRSASLRPPRPPTSTHPGGEPAVLPRQRGHRASYPGVHPLERRSDGDPCQQVRRRHRRPPLHLPRHPLRSTRSGSTTSSRGRTTALRATTSTTRATPPRASTPVRTSRVASPNRISTTSAWKSAEPDCRATASSAHAALLGVPDGVDGARSDQLDLPRPLQQVLHDRRLEDTSQPDLVVLGRRRMRRARDLGAIALAGRPTSATSTGSSTATCSASTARSAATARSSRNSRACSAGRMERHQGRLGLGMDELLHRDVDGVLLNKMNTTVDGEYQRYATENGAYIREHFFGPTLACASWSSISPTAISRTCREAGTTTRRSTPPSRPRQRPPTCRRSSSPRR